MKINELIPSITDDFLQQQVERYRNMWGTEAKQEIKQGDKPVADQDKLKQGEQP